MGVPRPDPLALLVPLVHKDRREILVVHLDRRGQRDLLGIQKVPLDRLEHPERPEPLDPPAPRGLLGLRVILGPRALQAPLAQQGRRGIPVRMARPVLPGPQGPPGLQEQLAPQGRRAPRDPQETKGISGRMDLRGPPGQPEPRDPPARRDRPAPPAPPAPPGPRGPLGPLEQPDPPAPRGPLGPLEQPDPPAPRGPAVPSGPSSCGPGRSQPSRADGRFATVRLIPQDQTCETGSSLELARTTPEQPNPTSLLRSLSLVARSVITTRPTPSVMTERATRDSERSSDVGFG